MAVQQINGQCGVCIFREPGDAKEDVQGTGPSSRVLSGSAPFVIGSRQDVGPFVFLIRSTHKVIFILPSKITGNKILKTIRIEGEFFSALVILSYLPDKMLL